MPEAADIVLATDGLTKRYGRRVAVDGVSLRVAAGQIFGLIGPNGAGKSTLMKMLFSLVRPSAGRIHIFGIDAIAKRQLALSQTGAMIESPSFYLNLTGRTNLKLFSALSGGCDKAEMDEIVRFVRLDDRIDERVAVYSHGMRQRLGIALALLPRPRLVVLDEPADGLDPAAHRQMHQLITSLVRELGVTVLLSSHLLTEVEKICDAVAILAEGKCLYQGPLNQLLDDEQRWLLSVDAPGAAQAALRSIEGVSQIDTEDHTVSLSYPSTDPGPLIRKLMDTNVKLYSVQKQRKSLEECFLELTGGGVAADERR